MQNIWVSLAFHTKYRTIQPIHYTKQAYTNMDPITEVRKRPTQERSRQRVKKILEVSANRITEVGADQLKMSDIAKLAEVPIGSVYQYFPNKSSIIRSLAEDHLEKLRKILIDGLMSIKLNDGADEIEQLTAMTDTIIDTYYEFYRYEPAFHSLWGGLQADAMLNDLEVQDTKESADLLFEVLKPVFTPQQEESYLKTLALLICTQIGATLRFAIQLPEEQGSEFVRVFKDQLRVLAIALKG